MLYCNVFGLCLHVFLHTNDRHRKGKKYAVHYVKEGPKVDTACTETHYALTTKPDDVAGEYLATCMLF